MRRTHRPWTAQDDAHLRKFHAEGKDDPTIGYILGRHRRLVGIKRKLLGLPANSQGGSPGLSPSPETRAKIGATSRQRWQDPEYKARLMKHLDRARAASSACRVKLPPRGTPEHAAYRKIRDNLGTQEGHKFLAAIAGP
jgi:hypothetical protein